MADIRDTLLLPFDRGELAEPSAGSRFLFINARLLPAGRFRDAVICEQSFRPDFLQLQQAGYEVVPDWQPSPNEAAAGALMLIGRARRRNELDLHRARSLTRDGAAIVIAGAKNDGIASLRKWAAGHVEITDSRSKHHGMVFWFTRSGDANPFPSSAGATGRPDAVMDPGMSPGMFSADAPDQGSALLAEHFDAAISGDVADFGAGWGYLSRALLESGAGPASLDCYEADWRSLEQCKINLDTHADRLPIGFHWIDLAGEPVARRFDWIVMNPPFHVGRAAEPALGQAFIRVAATALKRGGRLMMVANRNLPYERTLQEHFGSVERLREEQGFKLFLARR